MNASEALRVAEYILGHGRAFNEGWFCEGSPESGPSGGATSVVALGRVRLEVSRNGTCYLVRNTRSGWPAYETIYGSHYGSGHWGVKEDGSVWVDARRQHIRDRVEAAAG